MSAVGWSPDAEATSVVDFGVTRDGYTQLRRRWMAEEAHAAVVIVHGLGEHSGRYEHVGSSLAEAGIHAIAYDQRGFGESGGTRSHVDRFTHFLDDLEDQLAEVRRLGLPTVVLGHSMGGLVAACHALSTRPAPDRLVLSAPALALDTPAPLAFVAHGVSRVAPRLQITPPFGPDDLATDPRVGQAYESDPFVQRRMTVRLADEMMRAVHWVAHRHDRLEIPTLVLHGLDDTIVKPEASEALGALPAAERRTYAGLRHEILNEPSGAAIIDEIVAWVGGEGLGG